MLRSISLKAFLISNLVNLLLYAVGLIVWVAGWLAYSTIANGETVEHLTRHLSVATLVVLGISINLFASIPAGYAAARLAKRAELLHGALSTTFIILIGLYSDFVGFPSFGDDDSAQLPRALDVVISYSVPLLGMLGAYLSTRRLRPATA